MSEDLGGEPVCYVSQADASGRILRPEERISTSSEAPGASRIVIHSSDILAPRPHEDVDEYKQRLEKPSERTAAWKLGLRALETPLLLVPGSSMSREHVDSLAEYVRTLITED